MSCLLLVLGREGSTGENPLGVVVGDSCPLSTWSGGASFLTAPTLVLLDVFPGCDHCILFVPSGAALNKPRPMLM